MRRRIITISLAVPLALALFAFPRLSSTASPPIPVQQKSERRGRAARRVPSAPNRTAAAGQDYSKFSHRSRSHRQACDSCHKAPTANWRAARGFPDVADFPDHESCVGCHRQQFFNGARPVICAICHTRTSPRDDLRFAFGQPAPARQSQRRPEVRQFTIEFPHDKHQDVLASVAPATPAHDAAGFAHARMGPSLIKPDDEKRPQFNNCAICHETNRRAPQPPRGGWPGAFVPPPETFKTTPSSHASCFNCHWKSQEPTKDDCAGCHKAASDFAPLEWPVRISARFIHEGGGPNKDHIMECTTCHINITKASSLRGLRPDVPIAACATCHNNDSQTSTYKRITTIEMELDQFEKSHNCAYCHTPDVGRKEAPQSHCVAVGIAPAKCGNSK